MYSIITIASNKIRVDHLLMVMADQADFSKTVVYYEVGSRKLRIIGVVTKVIEPEG